MKLNLFLQVKNLVSLVIPLREVRKVDPVNNQSDNTMSGKSILLSTSNATFMFAQIHDRKFVVAKLSELLSKTDYPVQYV